MKKALFLVLVILSVSCNRSSRQTRDERIITVSIAPYKFFIDSISGGDFLVNVMVPAGADPHIYEPVPEQITRLSSSEAYISNGFLGFEMVWLERLYQVNKKMRKLNLGEVIEPIAPQEDHHGEHQEGADPHYWVAPSCALKMAPVIKDFLIELNPLGKDKYEQNCASLVSGINAMDQRARTMFAGYQSAPFMIYHPNLAYIARDYGLREISVESEGKEPSPAAMKALIDEARKYNIKTIFVQKEYDRRNARAIASEIGAQLVIIDPLSENWSESVNFILDALYKSFNGSI
ncbi:MAG TPA: zinc ABC transporter substrate-binding protein [Bacteroidales bacterium]|nr:zinc ABC transporter substrate-binding protein [Bacteroidales bacterium]